MEIKVKTSQMLKILQVLSWIIFVGLCIEAGGVLFNAIYTFAINPATDRQFWEGMNLAVLYHYDAGQFIVMVLLIFIVALMKVLMFYVIIKLFAEKKLNLAQPFNAALKTLLMTVAYLSLGIGLFSYSGCEYAQWLSAQKVYMPDAGSLHLSGADVWLFMAVILFVVAQLVKRGIEIQQENDLTI